jgi:hypothetical protein
MSQCRFTERDGYAVNDTRRGIYLCLLLVFPMSNCYYNSTKKKAIERKARDGNAFFLFFSRGTFFPSVENAQDEKFATMVLLAIQ